ncbi:alpha/beta fold hydrolase [Actinoplanes subtropicus]|uniref:alpha/beta fold hydrolase n=1 Tax=Actinoplanes subtropicus TaxID=543632 RepID=UPI001FE115E7|nr:alpha/beta hydrolase [Actinoplanes subtropicus]
MEAFSRNGMLFTVLDEGPVDAETVVLLHGFPQSARSWLGVSRPLLAASYRVVAPDQRGYTPQARPRSRRAYRLDELVADVVALVDATGVERVHLVGHDWGGGVAWMVAATRPDRLHTLTVVSAPHPRAAVQAMLSSRQALPSGRGEAGTPWQCSSHPAGAETLSVLVTVMLVADACGRRLGWIPAASSRR